MSIWAVYVHDQIENFRSQFLSSPKRSFLKILSYQDSLDGDQWEPSYEKDSLDP